MSSPTNLTHKTIREEQKNPKVSRRKEIIKIRSEIKEKEMKETIAKINETKSWFFEKINNQTLHLKQLEIKEQTKPKVSRRKEIS